MKNVDIKIETPRGTMNIHTEYSTKAEATSDGWGVWFQHGDVFILARENRCGAICPAEY